MEDRCRLCGRRGADGSEYCPYHQRAYANLKGAFERWRHALDIDWEGFLKEASSNPETGEWAKEVAEDLMQRRANSGPPS